MKLQKRNVKVQKENFLITTFNCPITVPGAKEWVRAFHLDWGEFHFAVAAGGPPGLAVSALLEDSRLADCDGLAVLTLSG